MLEFVDTMLDYWDCSGVRLLYTDTDSIFVALSVPWNEIALPETADHYWQHVYPKWFCDDPNSDKAKTPGITTSTEIAKYLIFFFRHLQIRMETYKWVLCRVI